MKLFGTNLSKQDKGQPQAARPPLLEKRKDTLQEAPELPEKDVILSSPAYEDVPIWNILPSYQLYQSTFSKNILPSNEDLRYAPPTYDTSSVTPQETHSINQSNDYFPVLPESPEFQAAQIHSSQPSPNPAQVDLESPTRWENSILGNIHRLKNLSDINSNIANRLKIEIEITEKSCQRGVKPTIIDPLTIEYQLGDSINGFITVRNISNSPILFDMFSVVFEGKISVTSDTDKKKSLVFYKFLNMFDYNASWTPADMGDETDADMIDPLDNTLLKFPMEKVFEPRITYKKFFNFKLPDKLLDAACEVHNLTRHCEILPTLGLAKDQFLKSLRRFREGNQGLNNRKSGVEVSGPSPALNQTRKPGLSGVLDRRLKDLSFPDTAVSYSVEARVIGKASDYENIIRKHSIKSQADEFIVVNESSCFIRVIPRERLSHVFDEEMIEKESRLIYNNLVTRITQKIELGKDLLNEKRPQILDNTNTYELTRVPSITKRRQLYNDRHDTHVGFNRFSGQDTNSYYELFVPYKKKSLTAASKIIGMVGVSTPKTEYKLKYVPPYKYRTLHPHVPRKELKTTLNIPLEFVFSFQDNSAKTLKPPDIKSISAELIVFTYRSRKYPIPIEIFSDLLFKNKLENDNIENYLVKPFQKYLEEITDLTRKLSCEVLNVDSQLIMDMKCLANLSTKYNSLKVDDSKVSSNIASVPWRYVPGGGKPDGDQEVFSKPVNISVDLGNVFSKESNLSHDEFTAEAYSLVPNFQSCIIGRAYYLRLNIKLQNNDSMTVRVPISIQL